MLRIAERDIGMKKKRMVIPLVILAFLFLSGIFLVIMISTNGTLDKMEPTMYKSLDDFKTKKITEAVRNMVSNTDRKVQLEITEQELNELIALLVKDFEKNFDNIVINGYRAEIDAKSLILRLDSKLLEWLPTQFVVKIIPSIQNGAIYLKISEIKVGKLPVNPKIILKQIKASDKSNFSIDLDQQSIMLINKYAEQMMLKDVELEKGKAVLKVEIKIDSLNDLAGILNNVIPDGLKKLFGV